MLAQGLQTRVPSAFHFFDPPSSDVGFLSSGCYCSAPKTGRKYGLVGCSYLISLFVRSKMFLRNQPTDFPLHPGSHHWVTWSSLGKQVYVIFSAYGGKKDFLTRPKAMGMTVSCQSAVSFMAALKKHHRQVWLGWIAGSWGMHLPFWVSVSSSEEWSPGSFPTVILSYSACDSGSLLKWFG